MASVRHHPMIEFLTLPFTNLYHLPWPLKLHSMPSLVHVLYKNIIIRPVITAYVTAYTLLSSFYSLISLGWILQKQTEVAFLPLPL